MVRNASDAPGSTGAEGAATCAETPFAEAPFAEAPSEPAAQLDRISRSGKIAISMAVDACAATLAIVLVAGILPPALPGAHPVGALTPLIAGAVLLLCYGVTGVYRHAVRSISRRIFYDLALGATLAVALLIAGEAAVRGGLAPVLPVMLFGMIALLGSGAARLVWSDLYRRHGWRLNPGRRVAVWGAGMAGIQLATVLEQSPAWHLAAFIDSDPTKQAITIRGLRVRTPDDLDQLRRDGVEHVVLAIPSASAAERARVTRQILAAGLKAQTVPRLESIMLGQNLSAIEDVSVEEILERKVVAPITGLLGAHSQGRAVLVTGAGGSIGSEIARQIARLGTARLVLLDSSEYALYRIETELTDIRDQAAPGLEIQSVLGSVCDRALMQATLERHGIDVVYHAAAHKHVPLVEANPVEGLRNNTLGTWYAALAAGEAGVERFVLVSTDKAVRPTSLMGASKRLAERAIETAQRKHPGTVFTAVRFGNVMESSGSVIPRFRAQIHRGGPVTVTHPEVTRYFMTITEAAQLVIQSAALAKGGEVFALDMGAPVRIVDLARRLIALSGLSEKTPEHPDGEIGIAFTGLRPGEKLYEELLIGDAPAPTAHPKIFSAQDNAGRHVDFEALSGELEALVAGRATERLIALCRDHVEGYQPTRPRIVSVKPEPVREDTAVPDKADSTPDQNRPDHDHPDQDRPGHISVAG